MSRSCEEDPPFDYLLTLFLETSRQPLTVLPTHRIVRGLGESGVSAMLERLDGLFDVRRGVDAAELRRGSGRSAWPMAAKAGSGCGPATVARS